jgi:hypothetical protein
MVPTFYKNVSLKFHLWSRYNIWFKASQRWKRRFLALRYVTLRNILRSVKAKSAKKNPELSDNPSDEEIICHVTSTIVPPATIENMDRLDMSYHQYQSQPILAPICRFEAHNDHIMNMLPEMNETNDIGDDTVIGGINSQLQPQSKL